MMVTKEMKLQMYQKMLLIRYFEEGIYQAYTHGWMPGLAHLYIGEEAVAVGACSALEKNDYVLSTHRGHGHLIAKGGDIKVMMAEVMGKKVGYCKGKGGSLHICAPELGMLGANGIVGGGIPIAAGVGLSSKYKNDGRVTLCFFGDGASNQGYFHEGINLASTWSLPVVYICENNLYAVSVHQRKSQNIKDIATRATSYGIPGEVVDGNDVIAVYETTLTAVDRARAGKGPTLIEAKTYRWGGHHVGEPGTTYRSKEEVAEWKKRCPIKNFEAKLTKEKILNDEKVEKVKQEIKKKTDESIQFARNAPYPEKEEALEDVFLSRGVGL